MDPLLPVEGSYLYALITQLHSNKSCFKAVLEKGSSELLVMGEGSSQKVLVYPAFWFESKAREYLIPLHIMIRFDLKHPQQAAEPPTP